jgi:antitoxin HigA-1
MTKKLAPVHPGEVLREEFLIPMNLTPYAVAQALRVPRTRIERLTREKTAITANTALRLARYFRTTPDFWLNLQTQFDLERAADETSPEIERIEPIGVRGFPPVAMGRVRGFDRRAAGTHGSHRRRPDARAV